MQKHRWLESVRTAEGIRAQTKGKQFCGFNGTNDEALHTAWMCAKVTKASGPSNTIEC